MCNLEEKNLGEEGWCDTWLMSVATLCFSAATCRELLVGFQPRRRVDDDALPLLRADNGSEGFCLIGEDPMLRVDAIPRMGETATVRVEGRDLWN